MPRKIRVGGQLFIIHLVYRTLFKWFRLFTAKNMLKNSRRNLCFVGIYEGCFANIDIGYLCSQEHSSQYLGLPTKIKFGQETSHNFSRSAFVPNDTLLDLFWIDFAAKLCPCFINFYILHLINRPSSVQFSDKISSISVMERSTMGFSPSQFPANLSLFDFHIGCKQFLFAKRENKLNWIGIVKTKVLQIKREKTVIDHWHQYSTTDHFTTGHNKVSKRIFFILSCSSRTLLTCQTGGLYIFFI